MNLIDDLSISALNPYERFCECRKDCSCGENNSHEWAWDDKLVTETSELSKRNLEAKFYATYSNGTTAVRGNQLMTRGRHYYWEIKMITQIYGTDVMVGVGTEKAQLQVQDKFCSLLGKDRESWGFSYKGNIQHAGEKRSYASRYGQGSIVGIHLNTWKGTLQFFLNRKPLGIAFTGLHNFKLYPMVSSTAAGSIIRIAQSCSVPASLQMDCLSKLKKVHLSYLSTAFPGLRYLSHGIFADILRRNEDGNDDEDDDYEYEFPEEYMILDDFDYALIGFGKRQKRKLIKSSKLKTVESP